MRIRPVICALSLCGVLAAGERSALVPEGGREPVFSGDGHCVVYRADADSGEPELWKIDLGTGRRTNFSLAGSSPARIPGTNRMLFLGPGIFPELFRLDIGSGKAEHLEVPEPPTGIPFPAGERQFAYPAGYDNTPRLVFFDPETAKPVKPGTPLPPGSVKVSPGGKYAARQIRSGGTGNLEIVELKTGKTVFRTDAKSGAMQINGCHSPAFAPGDRYLVYVSGGIQPLADLVLADLETGKTRKLTDDGADNQSPDFSPEGDRLVFSAHRDGRYQIFMMNMR